MPALEQYYPCLHSACEKWEKNMNLPMTRANKNYFRCLLVVRAKTGLRHEVTEMAGM